MKYHDTLVLGAGVQGVLVALMLANRNRKVTLIDRGARMLRGASLNYEGRIHSGMLYAMDRTFNTATRMAEDAVAFAPAIERFLGTAIDWSQLRSTPSSYFVHRDSHLSAEDLIAFWSRLEALIMNLLARPNAHYVGTRPKRFFRATHIPAEARHGVITHAFLTEETCIDQLGLHSLIEAAVKAHPRIDCLFGEQVQAIEPVGSDQIAVSTVDHGGAHTQHQAGLVVNCLWEARALFDRDMGIVDNEGESLRLKYSLLLKNNAFLRHLGSFILTHGAFGSVVLAPGSETAFASWYPGCLDGIIPVQPLPDSWSALQSGEIPKTTRDRVLADNISGFREIFPDFPTPEVKLIKAGVIVAHGMHDIDKTDSGFHCRDKQPIRQKGNYVSVATGKYVSAGRNALRLEQILFGDKVEDSARWFPTPITDQ